MSCWAPRAAATPGWAGAPWARGTDLPGLDKYDWVLEIAAVGQHRARERAVPSCTSLSHLGSRVTAGWWPQAGSDEGWDSPVQGWGARGVLPGGVGQRDRMTHRSAGQRDRGASRTEERCHSQKCRTLGRDSTRGVGQKDRTVTSGAGQRDRAMPRDAGQWDGDIPRSAGQKDRTVPKVSGQRDGVTQMQDRAMPRDVGQRDGVIPRI